MVADIFQNIFSGIEDLFNKFGGFINENFDNPIMWIFLLIAILLLGYFAINTLDRK